MSWSLLVKEGAGVRSQPFGASACACHSDDFLKCHCITAPLHSQEQTEEGCSCRQARRNVPAIKSFLRAPANLASRRGEGEGGTFSCSQWTVKMVKDKDCFLLCT